MKLYLIYYGNTYFGGYGAYIHTFGVFTSLKAAEIAKKNAEEEYLKYGHPTDEVEEVEFSIEEIEADEKIDIYLGGYVE